MLTNFIKNFLFKHLNLKENDDYVKKKNGCVRIKLPLETAENV